MYRLTTPTHTFTLPINTALCSEILVTYKQARTTVNKHYQDGTLPPGMTLDDKTIIIQLTQEETKKFAEGTVSIQVRVLTNAGQAFASQIFRAINNDVLNEEVLE